MAAIEAEKLNFTYPDADRAALSDATFSIPSGGFYLLMGPSGSGKSTLLRLLQGEIAPHGALSGQLHCDSPAGFVFQNPQDSLVTDSVQRELAFSPEHAGLDGAAVARRVGECAAFFHLEPLMERTTASLSGGEQQLLSLAAAMTGSPRVLLLDEPLSALDLKMRKEMQLELKRLQREMNITFIYVTHDQEEALTMSDTVVVMNGGKVQQIGTPEDIYNEPKNAFVADFIGDSNIVDGVMHKDFLVSFSGVDFPCVDRGFAREQSVQVVVRPEDIEVVSPVEGQLVGVVNDVIFKGVHFEMHVECEGREWLIHSTRACTPGETIGMRIGPNEIHIMARSEG